MIGGDRLFLKHIEPGSGDLPCDKRLIKRLFINDRAARRINENRRFSFAETPRG